jgi:hypothetical protein
LKLKPLLVVAHSSHQETQANNTIAHDHDRGENGIAGDACFV